MSEDRNFKWPPPRTPEGHKAFNAAILNAVKRKLGMPSGTILTPKHLLNSELGIPRELIDHPAIQLFPLDPLQAIYAEPRLDCLLFVLDVNIGVNGEVLIRNKQGTGQENEGAIGALILERDRLLAVQASLPDEAKLRRHIQGIQGEIDERRALFEEQKRVDAELAGLPSHDSLKAQIEEITRRLQERQRLAAQLEDLKRALEKLPAAKEISERKKAIEQNRRELRSLKDRLDSLDRTERNLKKRLRRRARRLSERLAVVQAKRKALNAELDLGGLKRRIRSVERGSTKIRRRLRLAGPAELPIEEIGSGAAVDAAETRTAAQPATGPELDNANTITGTAGATEIPVAQNPDKPQPEPSEKSTEQTVIAPDSIEAAFGIVAEEILSSPELPIDEAWTDYHYDLLGVAENPENTHNSAEVEAGPLLELPPKIERAIRMLDDAAEALKELIRSKNGSSGKAIEVICNTRLPGIEKMLMNNSGDGQPGLTPPVVFAAGYELALFLPDEELKEIGRPLIQSIQRIIVHAAGETGELPINTREWARFVIKLKSVSNGEGIGLRNPTAAAAAKDFLKWTSDPVRNGPPREGPTEALTAQ